ncbi:hypothetical protein ACIP1U_19060 [Cupriavidus sp. NPDC089707]|uniref:hypothetical protein n=1 Tax=Cupriavidus sp. NPDC089707 TaxID=3363963 RepID=UPI00380DA446
MAASRVMAGSTSASVARMHSQKLLHALSSALTDSHDTSNPTPISACRHASRVLVLPLPARARRITQRWRRNSISRAISASRTISRRAPRGGTTLVPTAVGKEVEGDCGVLSMPL